MIIILIKEPYQDRHTVLQPEAKTRFAQPFTDGVLNIAHSIKQIIEPSRLTTKNNVHLDKVPGKTGIQKKIVIVHPRAAIL